MAAKKTEETEELVSLPDIQDGELATVMSVKLVSKKTEPPEPYTEGLILEDMMDAAKFIQEDPVLRKVLKKVTGIGTAATRDAVIEKLKEHKYLTKKGKHIVATDKGLALYQWLKQVYPAAVDVAMTARWEAELAHVEEVGGGPAFEAKVLRELNELIATLKAAPPMALTSTNSKESSMSDSSAPRTGSGKPTDKMLEYAKSIAKKLGMRIPDDVMTDFEACKTFINDNKDAAMRPSEKQLNFANSIAASKGLTVPPEALANGRELSAWIDENK